MESLEERVARLEEQVARLQRFVGVDPAGGAVRPEGSRLPPDFYSALRSGKKIMAIKIYREATGVPLREAKRAVDTMAREAMG